MRTVIQMTALVHDEVDSLALVKAHCNQRAYEKAVESIPEIIKKGHKVLLDAMSEYEPIKEKELAP